MISTQVLVVGAGPVGLLAALRLRREGVDVAVIDRHAADEAKSFAVALHPRSVALLAELGITEPLLWHGHSFKRVGVFAGHERQALLDLPSSHALAEGGLTLCQNVLRKALERTLRAEGVEVRYGTRLLSVEQGALGVQVIVAERPSALPGASEQQRTLSARFLIGADGVDSGVRSALGVALVARSWPETYGFFDVPGEARAGHDVQLSLGALSSAVYPLHGGMTRYSFELAAVPPSLDAGFFRELLQQRMPWQAAGAGAVEWSGWRSFRRAMVERFRVGRIFLAGDAGHGTSPLGAQSLNVGLREAKEVAEVLVECLRGAFDQAAAHYEVKRRLEWRRLLGDDAASLAPHAPAWVAAHVPRLVASLPASGDDLDDLLDQIGIVLP